MFKWLEEVLWIVEIPFVSRPGDYSSQRVNHLKDPKVTDERKRELTKPLADASERAWQAIIRMDVDALGKALSDTMTAWGIILPYTLDPYLNLDAEKSEQLREFVRKYD